VLLKLAQHLKNIESILNRHQSFSVTRAEFLKKYHEFMARFGTDEAELAQQLEIQKSHLVNSTMKYNEGVARVAQARKQNDYQRTTLIKVIQRHEEKNVELSAIKTSIRTIYNRPLAQSTTTPDQIQRVRGGEFDEEIMLEYIENRFNDLKDIVEDKKVQQNRFLHRRQRCHEEAVQPKVHRIAAVPEKEPSYDSRISVVSYCRTLEPNKDGNDGARGRERETEEGKSANDASIPRI
jgi:hypothetical protein